jgi:hypothetical protein
MLKTLARRVRHFAAIVSDLAFRPRAERLARHLETAVAEVAVMTPFPLITQRSLTQIQPREITKDGLVTPQRRRDRRSAVSGQ